MRVDPLQIEAANAYSLAGPLSRLSPSTLSSYRASLQPLLPTRRRTRATQTLLPDNLSGHRLGIRNLLPPAVRAFHANQLPFVLRVAFSPLMAHLILHSHIHSKDRRTIAFRNLSQVFQHLRWVNPSDILHAPVCYSIDSRIATGILNREKTPREMQLQQT